MELKYKLVSKLINLKKWFYEKYGKNSLFS